MAIADGVDRPIGVTINSVRDLYGNSVREGSRLAVGARAWYRRMRWWVLEWLAGRHDIGRRAGAQRRRFPRRRAERRRRAGVVLRVPARHAHERVRSDRPSRRSAPTNCSGGTAPGRSPKPSSRSSPAGAETGPITALPATLTASGADNRSVDHHRGHHRSQRPARPRRLRRSPSPRGRGTGSRMAGTRTDRSAAPSRWHRRDQRRRLQDLHRDRRPGDVHLLERRTRPVALRDRDTVLSVLPAKRGRGSATARSPFAEVVIPQGGITSAVVTATPGVDPRRRRAAPDRGPRQRHPRRARQHRARWHAHRL